VGGPPARGLTHSRALTPSGVVPWHRGRETFSGFLTQSCGFTVTVTDTERDTVVDNGTVFVLSVHNTADVLGNGHRIMLRTLDDGTTVFHPAFPVFDLCDYLR